MSLEKFFKLYKDNGFDVELVDDKFTLKIDNLIVQCTIEEEWIKSIDSYFKAKQYIFDADTRSLTAYRFIELQVVRLDPSFLNRLEHTFEDERGNKVVLSAGSKEYVLALMSSKETDGTIFDLIKKRIKRRGEIRAKRADGSFSMRFEDLIYVPFTASYQVTRKLKPETLQERGRKRIKACLFKLSYSSNECWELRETIKSKSPYINLGDDEVDFSIPRADYLDDLVSYYKVAKSSQYPNQAFLSYYHILEYFFLRVSDEKIFESVKAHVNSLDFSTSYEHINKLLAIVKKADNTSDETEMLKSVLNRYVVESDLVEFLIDLEEKSGGKIFSDNKKIVFGEKATIKLEQGHALSNSAKVIKHIRNSLVHSSDRYSREDCFLPFSESESIVFEYVPLIKYLAERVIFATAT
ncbi:hypothetical protein ACB316_18195 [Aeromonas sanarellii]